MSLITPFPEAESSALDRFALHGRDGIAALLGELRHRGSLVTLYYDSAAGFAVGNVLDVDAEREAVVLDCAGDGDVQRSIALAGDIVVCLPVVRREAHAQHKTLRAHLAHLVVHGMLHLQGYDHQRDADAAAMESRETEILRRLRYADPYAES